MADVPNVSFWERGERQQVRRWPLGGGAALLFLGMGLVAASPVMLYRLGVAGGVEWDEIGAIGDAHGAAATLLTAVSLVGITVSLLLGAKDSRTNRAQAVRTFHFKLVRMQLEGPELQWAKASARRPAMKDTPTGSGPTNPAGTETLGIARRGGRGEAVVARAAVDGPGGRIGGRGDGVEAVPGEQVVDRARRPPGQCRWCP
ncbi:DUF6082 family protein [Actinomadura livida]|uniref:Uncharacterized protein n=1 Tax=Actinomadura livida TaxID=79909 RepID=A0A7W7IC83_9ACTN|nr:MULTISPECIES: DUF6082 family protein [Actinomadura]MBB4774432.1 hypothetical protein [Actinomadura catellatispora]GGT82562.1 hypothetical protein GCM10010208_01130 [Actinomadura livida]